ncbi:unnamed protein product [Symbiodinium sp. KB8]|nr:unnamed protein product [Symbiodinium sp. KB8]
MADSAAGPEVSEASLDPCVILQAWKSSPTVMNRLIQGCLVFLPPETKKIKREHLGENVDLLGPMINNLGHEIQVQAWMARRLITCFSQLAKRGSAAGDEAGDDDDDDDEIDEGEDEGEAGESEAGEDDEVMELEDGAPGREPLSPRSQAKQRKQHYLVKDRSYGYLCVLCGGNSQDIRELKARQCFALPDLQPLDARLETASKSSGRASKAGSLPRDAGPKGCLTPTEAESEVTPEQAMMLEELASLQKQQALLEELLQLQELKDYEKALQEEEEFFEQALRRSALEAEEQELTKRKRSVEAEKKAEVAPAKIPKKTPVNDELPAAIPAESTAAEAYEAGEAPHAIVESAKAESREAKEAPQAIVESAKAESREAKAPQAIVESAKAESREAKAPQAIVESAKAESREAEEAPAAILESAKAESREAEEAPTAILESAKAESREAEEAPVIRSVKPVGPGLVDTLPQELCFDEPCMEARLVTEDGMGADLLGTCRRLQVPVEKDSKGKDEQASSVSLRIAPESDCDEDGEEEPLEDDVVLDVKDGKLEEAAKASEDPAKAVSPSKATVFYEHTLPPCPVEMDHKPTTPAEEEEQEDEEQEDEQSEDEPSIGPNHETDDEDDGKCGKGPKVPIPSATSNKRKRQDPAPAPKGSAKAKSKASAKNSADEARLSGKTEEEAKEAGKQVLCLRWMSNLAFDERYTFCEVFAWSVNLDNSDKEIFASLPTGDLWLDARVHETFLIPDSWAGVMESFKDDIVQKAPSLSNLSWIVHLYNHLSKNVF